MSYDEFLKEKCDLTSGDPYKAVGYTAPEYATMRYDVVGEMLLSFPYKIESIVDAGAGCCTMWIHFANNGTLKALAQKGLSKVCLLDKTEQYWPVQAEIIQTGFWKDHGINVELVNADFTRDILPFVDVYVSIEAIGFYNFFELTSLMRRFNRAARIGMIVETNLQTHDHASVAGVHVPSISQMYEMFYDMCLHDGKGYVDAHFFKKWTAIFRMVRGAESA